MTFLDGPRMHDIATRFSRLELALAFLAAAFLGGILNALQEILLPGKASDEVKWLAALLLLGLVAICIAWGLARTRSLDVGACLIIRPGELDNRQEVSAALKRSSRSWVPLEVVDNLNSWSEGPPKAVLELTQSVVAPLSNPVGVPRVLIALSSSDAIGFALGNILRPTLFGAEVQIMTLPTRSQVWRPVRYHVGQDFHRRFFEGRDLSGIGCGCPNPRGVGVIDRLRSPDHNPEVVLAGLLAQQIVCCTRAIHLIASARPSSAPVSEDETFAAARFVRARARWLARDRTDNEINVTLTVGPEASMVLGLVLSGFSGWRVWEFDRDQSKWRARWTSDHA
ncbi:hypothetical protein [Nocardioides marmoriginsengisoli]|uniref:hypothetical protein n=1 Tax=Nocardioides marmoriginsengisoli TaxID=661483 RepID=UPI0011CD9226|nr:hypothetical protein [Nocardioides marmoriginsengisoli]